MLLGETLGLQDVLTEAGAEAAATAAQLAALGVQLERSQARVQEVCKFATKNLGLHSVKLTRNPLNTKAPG